MDKILDGKLVSSKIKEELINDIKNIDDTLTLAVLQVGNNEASNIYVSKKILWIVCIRRFFVTFLA